MNALFVAGFSPIAADPGAGRELYGHGLGIAFEGGEGDYVFTEH